MLSNDLKVSIMTRNIATRLVLTIALFNAAAGVQAAGLSHAGGGGPYPDHMQPDCPMPAQLALTPTAPVPCRIPAIRTPTVRMWSPTER